MKFNQDTTRLFLLVGIVFIFLINSKAYQTSMIAKNAIIGKNTYFMI